MNQLYEETWLSFGTKLRSSVFGDCRVRYLGKNKLSAIIGDKPLGSNGDVWFRIMEDGRILEWASDAVVEVVGG